MSGDDQRDPKAPHVVDGKIRPHWTHQWKEDRPQTRCINCGGYRHLSSGFFPCPAFREQQPPPESQRATPMQQPKQPPFGRSLHVDVYGVTAVDLDSIDFFYVLLVDLCRFLGMHEQAPPDVFRTPAQWAGKEGLSGYLPLVESGISVHTLTKSNFVTLDVYTCGELDVERTVAFLTDRLGSKDVETQFLLRGTRYAGGAEAALAAGAAKDQKNRLDTLFHENPATPEGKYLVKRRDGSVPGSPSFVLLGADPMAPWTLRFYSLLGFVMRHFSWSLVKSMWRFASRMTAHRKKHGKGDPGMGKHRIDDPATLAEMRKGQSA